MPPESNDLARLFEAVEALRLEVARLADRVSAVESAATTSAIPEAAPPIGEELVLVISSAIAAFLGKRAHIRQIRLLGSAAWAQQGRVTVQASHRLAVQHGS